MENEEQREFLGRRGGAGPLRKMHEKQRMWVAGQLSLGGQASSSPGTFPVELRVWGKPSVPEKTSWLVILLLFQE